MGGGSGALGHTEPMKPLVSHSRDQFHFIVDTTAQSLVGALRTPNSWPS